MKAIILVGGKGEKIWPYSDIRNKCMIPISNKPIVDYTVQSLLKEEVDVYIVGSSFMDEIKHYYRNTNVHIIETEYTKGNVDTLLNSGIREDCLVFFGDCMIDEKDIESIIHSKINTVLLAKALDDPHNHIIANIDKTIEGFIAYPRGYEEGYYMVGGYFDSKLFDVLEYNNGRFRNTKVGVGAPNEKVLEESLNDYIEERELHYILCNEYALDIDKPWDILQANFMMNKKRCSSIEDNKIEGHVDESANITGKVVLGKGSCIGKNVCIKGNVIIGNNTNIDNGATIEGNVVIGDGCVIQNYCKIGSGTTIGNNCIVEQTAEIIGGMIMDKNYLYHHGEFFGLCGERCDLGAGTVCGTLRFDDGGTIHSLTGRKEMPKWFSNATFLGDYTRSGVGVIFLPGVIVGTNCVVGAGTILNKVVKSNTLIYPKQELVEKEWNYKKYGW